MKWRCYAGLALFGLGFSLAWSLKPGQTLSSRSLEIAQENTRTSPTRRAVDPPNPSMTRRVRECLHQLEAATGSESGLRGFDVSEIRSALLALDPAEIPQMIEQMTRRAGFSGLDRQQLGLLKDLVTGWFEKDQQSALDWVLAIENVKDRQLLMSEIVAKAAEKDFDHAIELAKKHGTREAGGLQFPYELQKRLSELDADRMWDLLSSFPSIAGSSASSIAFNKDFDFPRMAELLRAHSKTAGRLSFFPGNFLKEWTMQDPQAAWNWVTDPKGLEHTESVVDVSEFFEAYRMNHPPQEVNDLILDQMSKQTDIDQKFSFAWNCLAARVDPVQISDLINRLPGDRSDNLRRLVRASTNGSGGSFDEFKEAIAKIMSPQERLAIVPEAINSFGSPDTRYLQILKRLGHSEAELQRATPNQK